MRGQIVNDIPAPLSPINNLSGYVELVKKEERKRKAESEDNRWAGAITERRVT